MRHAVRRIVAIVPVALTAALLAAPAAWAQEAGQEVDNTGADAPVDEAAAQDTVEDTADRRVEQPGDRAVERPVGENPVELDERSYADAEEEDFVPSEDIPTDQAIAFPTDI